MYYTHTHTQLAVDTAPNQNHYPDNLRRCEYGDIPVGSIAELTDDLS